MKKMSLRNNKVLNIVAAIALFVVQTNITFAQPSSYQLPSGYQIVNGKVVVTTQGGSVMTVYASNGSIINWNSFNIGALDTVNFNQPNSSSAVLNRVTGNNASYILGALNGNGQVFIINRNGIVFGQNSHINVNGLLASTLDITDGDFIKRKYNFQQTGQPSYIINQGNIHVNNGGFVILLSGAINNSGIIQAQLGHVVLASGSKMTVALDDNNDISVDITQALQNNVFGPNGTRILQAIQNSGTIAADGGSVLISAQILNKIFVNAVNNTGVIQANSLVNHNGSVEINAIGGDITSAQGSTISAKASDSTANGGQVAISTDQNIDIGGTVDVSGGSKSGNGGGATINAGKNINFHGTTIGNAVSGYQQGTVFMNSGTASVSGNFDANTTISTNVGNITLNGNSIIGDGNTLNLYANSRASVPDIYSGPGSNVNTNMAITDLGNYTISAAVNGSGTLNLQAGSGGIGTDAAGDSNNAILVNGLGSVSAMINPNVSGGDINITSTNSNLNVGTINSGSGFITLQANGNGSIFNASSNSLISGSGAYLNAAGSIGEGGHFLNTAVGSLDANANGPIFINQTGNLNIGSVSTGGNSSSLVDIRSTGNIDQGNINAAGGAADVILVSKGGSITNNNNGNIVADSVILNAKNNIGTSANRVSASTYNLYANNTTGDMYFSLNPAASIHNLSGPDGNTNLNLSAANGLIDVMSDGQITAQNVTTGGSSNNSINLTTSYGDVDLGNVNADAGLADLNVSSSGNINLIANANVNANNISLTTGYSTNPQGDALIFGNVNYAPGVNIHGALTSTTLNGHQVLVINNPAGAVSYSIYFLAYNNLLQPIGTWQNVATISASNGGKTIWTDPTAALSGQVGSYYVVVNSVSTPSILSAGPNSTITGNSLYMNAAGSVGTSSQAINTKVADLTALANKGVVNINQTGDLSIGSVSTWDAVSPITINATGNIDEGAISASQGAADVFLTSGGSITNNSNNGNIIANNVTLVSKNNMGTSANRVNISANAINASNTTGDIYIYRGSGASINNLTGPNGNVILNISAPNGLVDVISDGEMTAQNITTGGSSNNGVNLKTTYGDIDLGNINADGGLANLNVDSSGNINTTSSTNINVNALSLKAGDYSPNPLGDSLIFGNINYAPGVNIHSALTTITSNGHQVLVINNPAEATSYEIYFLAYNNLLQPIGTWTKVATISASNGGKTIWYDPRAAISGQVDSYYVVVNSVLNPPIIGPISPVINPAIQLATGLRNPYLFPTPDKMSKSQINPDDITTSSDLTGGSGGLFLYHPLSDVDSGAFDQEFQLDEGAYDFIEGEIEKKKTN